MLSSVLFSTASLDCLVRIAGHLQDLRSLLKHITDICSHSLPAILFTILQKQWKDIRDKVRMLDRLMLSTWGMPLTHAPIALSTVRRRQRRIDNLPSIKRWQCSSADKDERDRSRTLSRRRGTNAVLSKMERQGSERYRRGS